MIAFPLLAALVALAFGLHLLGRLPGRRAPHEAAWAAAMLMYAAASLALALGVLDGWTAAEFRLYWLLGAVLVVPYLLLGEALLLVRPAWARWLALVGILAATALAAGIVLSAPVHAGALGEEFPLGKDVFGDGSASHRLAQYYGWTAYVLLLAGALWSAGRMRGRPHLQARFRGTALIALGATVVAVGSGVGAAFGNFALFSVSLAAGAAVMYWGFLTATQRGRPPAVGQRPARA